MLTKPIILALLACFLAGVAHAQTLVLRPEDRFCLIRQSEPILSGCRAEKFPGQFYYTAYCPDPADSDAPDRHLLITDPSTVVMEGSPDCARLVTRATDVVFEPLGYRSDRTPSPEGAVQVEHVVRVLFGTNRAITQSQNQISFTTDRDRQLHLGSVAVSIPANHDKGKVERPWSFMIPWIRLTIDFKEDPNTHFSIRWMEQLSPKVFIEQLRDAMAYEDASTLKQALVFIHGYNVSFEDAAFRTAQIVHDMEFNGAPIFYSWPSRGEVDEYPYDKDSIRQARNYLGGFLRLVREESGADVVHLIAHSMGNDALLEALRDLNRRDGTKPLFGEVVLAAPDVAFDDFLERAEDIKGAALGFTLYANDNDRALNQSRRFWGGIQRAGDLPPLVVPGIDTIDITAIGSSLLSLNHSEYADNPALLADIAQILQNHLRPPSKRNPQLRQEGIAPNIYWRFVRP